MIFLLVALLAVAPGCASAAKVPPSFFGVMADGPLLFNGFNDQSEFDLMSQSGVETIRMAMPWSAMEPQPGQYDFAEKHVDSALRLSPHYYNTEAEVDAAVEALRESTR